MFLKHKMEITSQFPSSYSILTQYHRAYLSTLFYFMLGYMLIYMLINFKIMSELHSINCGNLE